MQRVNGLWSQVTSLENLYRAAYRVLGGKRDQVRTGDFFFALEHNLLQLQRELRTQTYCPGLYRTFLITTPKQRMISAAPFRDRVVHHALINVIEPIFERRFIHHSYACRTEKGTHRALQQFVTWTTVIALYPQDGHPQILPHVMLFLVAHAPGTARSCC